jgi:tetratricopeptide (TPR) repeat protein
MTLMQQENAEHLAMLGRKEFNAANQAWREHQVDDALSLYTEATLLNPILDLAHLGRARCLVHLSQWMPAREAFAQALRINPQNYSAWLEAGHLCRQMGELHQASGRYEAYLAMARVLKQLDQQSLSAEAFEKALVLSESSSMRAEVAHRMGQYLLELGDNTAAVDVLSLAIQSYQAQVGSAQALDFNLMAEVQIDLGEALWRLGRHDTAMQVLTQASAADHEPTLVRLGAAALDTTCGKRLYWCSENALSCIHIAQPQGGT